MLPLYLIGLREGLEAGLVVGILVAYLGKLGRRDLLPKLWIGVIGAIVVSLVVGAILTWGPYGLSFTAQEVLGGVLSIVAVGMVTWMILWMAKNARGLKGQLHGRMAAAVAGSGAGIVALGIISVGREGVETALFVWAATSSTVDPVASLGSAVAGILTAVAIAVLISFGLVRINLARFFTWTGFVLIVVAAGILAYGVGDLQEASVLPGGGQPAFSLVWLLPPGSWWASLLGGVFNATAEPTWAQVAAWVSYIAVVSVLFVREQRRPVVTPSTIPDGEVGAIGTAEPASREPVRAQH